MKACAEMTTDARQHRGLIIAATSRAIRQKGGVWTVPSQQNGHGPYHVNLQTKKCSCLDHVEGGHKCKHIWVAEIVYQREFEFNDDGSVTITETETVAVQAVKRTTYSQNWPAYNAAQVNEKSTFQVLLRDLCKGIVEPKNGMGRPRTPLADLIFSVVFKVFSTASGRRAMSDLVEACDKGFISRVPAFSSIFTVLESEATTDVLKMLIAESALPLKAMESHFSCDSSGFSGSRFDRWYDHKFGDVKIKRAWVKVHIMCGAKTNVITAVEIHHKDAGDCTQLPALLKSTADRFNVQELSADMAYASVRNFEEIDRAGAAALIPFKRGSTGNAGGLFAKAFHYFQAKRQEFDARYHKRSNIESTFSMVKAKFGDGVRSKTDVAMKNEVLAKILCHNICCLISAIYELGIDPVFWNEGQNTSVAV
jgi:transposase